MVQLAQKTEAPAVIHLLDFRILVGDPQIDTDFRVYRLYIEIGQLLPQSIPVRFLQLSDIRAVQQRLIIRIDHRVPDLLDIGAAVGNQAAKRILILDQKFQISAVLIIQILIQKLVTVMVPGNGQGICQCPGELHRLIVQRLVDFIQHILLNIFLRLPIVDSVLHHHGNHDPAQKEQNELL